MWFICFHSPKIYWLMFNLREFTFLIEPSVGKLVFEVDYNLCLLKQVDGLVLFYVSLKKKKLEKKNRTLSIFLCVM